MLIGTPSETPISVAPVRAGGVHHGVDVVRGSSSEGALATGSDRPEPRRSKVITRANDPSASSARANGSCSHTSSTCVREARHHDDVELALAEDLVGDVDVAGLRVAGLRRHHPMLPPDPPLRDHGVG